MRKKIFSDESAFFALSSVFFYLVIFLTFFVSGISILDPDFAWHLRVGQDILETKSVPHVEEYIFTTLGDKWVDHEWLSNLLLFLVYDFFGKFGYWALGIIFAAIATLTLFLISHSTKKYFLQNIGKWNFLLFEIVAIGLSFFALLRAYGIRLQVLTWLFFALIFIFYLKIVKEDKWRYLAGFPLLIFLWTNLHGTFVLGLAIILVVLFFLLFESKSLERKKRIALTIVLTIGATLLNPYGLELWKLVAIEYTQSRSYLTQIFEWLPLYTAPYIEWYSTFYISIIIFISGAYFKFRKVPKKRESLIYLLFVFVLMLMAIKARRFVPMFALSSFPLIIILLQSFFKKSSIKKKLGIFILVISTPLIIYQTYFISTVPLNLLTKNTIASPYDAVSFIKENNSTKDLRTYNRYGWGGYLVWMWPEKLHFIDGRMPQKPMPNNLSLIEEYFSFRESKEKAEEKLDEYKIELVLLEKEFSIKDIMPKTEKFILEKLFAVNLKDFDSEDYLRSYLKDNWQKIYEDEVAIIYLSPKITFQK